MNAQRIDTGTPEGDALGFTESLFSGWLELRDSNRLCLHYIISRRKNEGNTQNLIRRWLEQGYAVSVVMPRPIMQHILLKFGFIPSREFFPGQYESVVEVWNAPGLYPRPCPAAQAPGDGSSRTGQSGILPQQCL